MFENEGFHWRDNIFWKRLEDGSVRIAFFATRASGNIVDGDDEEPTRELIIPAAEWASIVNAVSGKGEKETAASAPERDEKAVRLTSEGAGETNQQKNERNARVSARYDELMQEGKHGHYETMYRVVREEIDRAHKPRPAPAAEVEQLREFADWNRKQSIPFPAPERTVDTTKLNATNVLLHAEREKLAAIKCRYGCDSPVVGLFSTPEGCLCWPDQMQALCAQHASKIDGGPVICVVDFRKFTDAPAAEMRERAEFKQQAFGADVATILETEDTLVEVVKLPRGHHQLVIHNRCGETDQWDDLSATLASHHFAALGSIAVKEEGYA